MTLYEDMKNHKPNGERGVVKDEQGKYEIMFDDKGFGLEVRSDLFKPHDYDYFSNLSIEMMIMEKMESHINWPKCPVCQSDLEIRTWNTYPEHYDWICDKCDTNESVYVKENAEEWYFMTQRFYSDVKKKVKECILGWFG